MLRVRGFRDFRDVGFRDCRGLGFIRCYVCRV